MARVHLGLGANLGDRLAALRAASALLAERVGPLVACSAIYETTPFGVTDQPRFLNACVALETGRSPRAVLSLVKAIETDLGRAAGIRWGPRHIDIDVLLFGDEAVAEPDLVIPHRGISDRAFVLVPLAEIAPDVAIPGLDVTVAEALRRVRRSPGDVVPIADRLVA